MKTLRKLFAGSALALLLANVSFADSFVFTDGHLQGNHWSNGYVLLESWGQTSYSNTWDISDEANFSTTLTFDSAVASFWFSDKATDDADEYVSIDLGAVTNWLGSTEVNGTFASYHLLSGNVNMSLLADIAADGKLTYRVEVDSGSTYLKETQLTVYAHVPEAGSTLAMLGLALIGLAALGRRK